MEVREVLPETATRSIELSGSKGMQGELVGLIRVFADKLRPVVREGDEPGLMAPAYVLRNGSKLGPGLVLALGDRLVLGWMKGFLKRPTTEVLSLGSIAGVKQSGRGPDSQFGKQLTSLSFQADQEWELLFTDEPGAARMREALAGLLVGAAV